MKRLLEDFRVIYLIVLSEQMGHRFIILLLYPINKLLDHTDSLFRPPSIV